MKKQKLGTSGLSVTPVAFGASALGNMPDTYGYEVSEARAQITLQKRSLRGQSIFWIRQIIMDWGVAKAGLGKRSKREGGYLTALC